MSDAKSVAIAETFRRCFGGAPTRIVRAPGRVNLIGEHTDYNDGFVLPMAIDRSVRIALRARTDRRVCVRSLEFNRQEEFGLQRMQRGGSGWAEYLKGVAWSLQQSGLAIGGWEGVLSSDIPIGAGLASSAALEIAAARAFAETSNLPWEPARFARLARRAENEWVGVGCGIMDQLACAAGRAGHALRIDCRSLELTPAPLPDKAAVVVLDTGTHRPLLDSAFDERRAQCAAAARALGVDTLREVSLEQLGGLPARLEPLLLRRARHVITENARVLAAFSALLAGDSGRLGPLMNASHASLRDDFEVTTTELDAIVMSAIRDASCFGARMTGAGFGGSAIALVRADAVADFAASVARDYRRESGRDANIFAVDAADGADAADADADAAGPITRGGGR